MIAVLARQLYATRSGRKSVKARLDGTWYCCSRFATTFISSNTCCFINLVILCGTWSCLALYHRSLSAVLQLFRMWHSVCRSPHSLHAADKWALFLHRARLALCGRVSVAKFRANFIRAEGSDWTALDHTAEAVESTRWNSLPCVSKERLCSRHLRFRWFNTAQ